jgi:hypothetical protein
MIVFGQTTKGYWPAAVDGRIPGGPDQIVGYPSHPFGFKMNSPYIVSLARTFEERYGIQFEGIRDGEVTDPRQRLIQFKTNVDIVMSVFFPVGSQAVARLRNGTDGTRSQIGFRFEDRWATFLTTVFCRQSAGLSQR